ncbi:MAG TPA: DUF2330 domain-containing protein [Allosphingosinicella sp.]|jgi:hypothetical protein|uniref:DUF2330 domain-containing protein n=1 Tax=Allosphingosinicella sp. TaxID=2823234 RepID=UPI002F281795
MRLRLLAAAAAALLAASPASAFCGFYVAKADTKLFNRASKVVLARDGNRNVITMAPDYQGSLRDFAMVIPVPTLIQRNQINVADPALVEKIDAYSAPRLVEYFDSDPCNPPPPPPPVAMSAESTVQVTGSRVRRANALGVKIEAQYQVGEYDILILSAKQSGGLVTWLTENGYRMPPGAGPTVASYLKQNMKFFVAKVNLDRQAAAGVQQLRPIQVAYEHRKFMLPIRLGTVNAAGPQELFVFALTPNGRVETTNYRTVKLPSDLDVPVFVKAQFPAFYKAMFGTAVNREQMRAVFLEYAWDSRSCDPCSGEPLRDDEARKLGAMWLAGENRDRGVFVTRLHLRYTRDTFPEDLMLQETSDSSNFQGRYVLRHAYTGPARCEAGRRYKQDLVRRWDKEAQTLANLTGWGINDIRGRMKLSGKAPEPEAWWDKLWGNLQHGLARITSAFV